MTALEIWGLEGGRVLGVPVFTLQFFSQIDWTMRRKQWILSSANYIGVWVWHVKTDLSQVVTTQYNHHSLRGFLVMKLLDCPFEISKHCWRKIVLKNSSCWCPLINFDFNMNFSGLSDVSQWNHVSLQFQTFVCSSVYECQYDTGVMYLNPRVLKWVTCQGSEDLKMRIVISIYSLIYCPQLPFAHVVEFNSCKWHFLCCLLFHSCPLIWPEIGSLFSFSLCP